MNWDAIGAIAELLGAVGVIASLVYLATQIRQSREQMGQNTRALRAGAYQQFIQGLDQLVMRASGGPALQQAVRRGMIDSDQLSEEDAYHFDMWIRGLLLAWENAHYQYRMGMLDSDRWRLHRGQLEETFDAPGVVQWWKRFPRGPEFFGPEFVALVSEILGEEPERADRPQ